MRDMAYAYHRALQIDREPASQQGVSRAAYPGTVAVDAVVLAGGRSARLGGEPKARLELGGSKLVERAVRAASACRQIVVVGDHVPGALFAREAPPFGGPAAGIAAGVRALSRAADLVPHPDLDLDLDLILVLACDVPRAAGAVVELLAGCSRIGSPGCDGLVAIDESGRAQPLLAIYSGAALRAATSRPDLHGLSVRALLTGLVTELVTVPSGSTDDVDTWDDANRLGIVAPAARSTTSSSPASSSGTSCSFPAPATSTHSSFSPTTSTFSSFSSTSISSSTARSTT